MASFIMAGRIQAALFVVLSTLISLLLPPLVVFSNAAIALITLRKGWQEGIAYTLLATLVLVLVSFSLKQAASSAIMAGLATWLPMVIIASVLAITQSWGKTLLFTLILGVAGVIIFHLTHQDAAAYWKPVLEQMKPFLQQAYQLNDSAIEEKIDIAAGWMTGTFAAALTVIVIASLIIARNWQALLYNPGGFGEEFRQLRIGKQAASALIVAIAVAVLSGNQLLIELIMVGLAVFMFQGLALFHALAKQKGMSTAWLIGLYVLLFIAFMQMIVLLATFGIIDSFVDLRRKIADKK